MNGIVIQAQQPLSFANQADVVLFGSGIFSKKVSEDPSLMSQFRLNPSGQLIGSQCSGALFLHRLNLIQNMPICTDRKTTGLFEDETIEVMEEPFHSSGNIATAGGCLSAHYLAAWVIWRLLGQSQAEAALRYVLPVGQEVEYLARVNEVLSPFIGVAQMI
jgi:transcriptional regulator GlxA family with amidase domain